MNGITDVNSKKWDNLGVRHVLRLFRDVAKNVPAYKNFLNDHKVDIDTIKTIQDFKKLPFTTKENYLRLYPRQELFWKGDLKGSFSITATSGSTGDPFYFFRNQLVDEQSAAFHELFLEQAHIAKKEPTLVLVCFGMGAWIGGIITYSAFKKVAQNGYALSVITPGTNKGEILNALRHLTTGFTNLVLCGYPPLLKDILDEAVGEGISLSHLNVKLLFAAEAFSEGFRQHLGAMIGSKNTHIDTSNIYGSADL
jgi:phenylacetate-CoA ligase